MIENIPYIVTGMIIYDLSIHFLYLIKKENFFLDRKLNWWPNFPNLEKRYENIYQVFWNIFWAVALVLMVMYLIYK